MCYTAASELVLFRLTEKESTSSKTETEHIHFSPIGLVIIRVAPSVIKSRLINRDLL